MQKKFETTQGPVQLNESMSKSSQLKFSQSNLLGQKQRKLMQECIKPPLLPLKQKKSVSIFSPQMNYTKQEPTRQEYIMYTSYSNNPYQINAKVENIDRNDRRVSSILPDFSLNYQYQNSSHLHNSKRLIDSVDISRINQLLSREEGFTSVHPQTSPEKSSDENFTQDFSCVNNIVQMDINLEQLKRQDILDNLTILLPPFKSIEKVTQSYLKFFNFPPLLAYFYETKLSFEKDKQSLRRFGIVSRYNKKDQEQKFQLFKVVLMQMIDKVYVQLNKINEYYQQTDQKSQDIITKLTSQLQQYDSIKKEMIDFYNTDKTKEEWDKLIQMCSTSRENSYRLMIQIQSEIIFCDFQCNESQTPNLQSSLKEGQQIISNLILNYEDQFIYLIKENESSQQILFHYIAYKDSNNEVEIRIFEDMFQFYDAIEDSKIKIKELFKALQLWISDKYKQIRQIIQKNFIFSELIQKQNIYIQILENVYDLKVVVCQKLPDQFSKLNEIIKNMQDGLSKIQLPYMKRMSHNDSIINNLKTQIKVFDTLLSKSLRYKDMIKDLEYSIIQIKNDDDIKNAVYASINLIKSHIAILELEISTVMGNLSDLKKKILDFEKIPHFERQLLHLKSDRMKLQDSIQSDMSDDIIDVCQEDIVNLRERYMVVQNEIEQLCIQGNYSNFRQQQFEVILNWIRAELITLDYIRVQIDYMKEQHQMSAFRIDKIQNYVSRLDEFTQRVNQITKFETINFNLSMQSEYVQILNDLKSKVHSIHNQQPILRIQEELNDEISLLEDLLKTQNSDQISQDIQSLKQLSEKFLYWKNIILTKLLIREIQKYESGTPALNDMEKVQQVYRIQEYLLEIQGFFQSHYIKDSLVQSQLFIKYLQSGIDRMRNIEKKILLS